MSSRHHKPKTFQDAAEGYNIASGKLAAVYVAHGSYQWSRQDVDRMAGVFGVSENPDPNAARFARCIAVEPGAGTVASVPGFLEQRFRLGHKDGMVYCDQSDLPACRSVAANAGFHPYFWVAAPGKSLAECVALAGSTGLGNMLVAVQNEWFTAYDQSVVLQPDSPAMHFTPPRDFHPTG